MREFDVDTIGGWDMDSGSDYEGEILLGPGQEERNPMPQELFSSHPSSVKTLVIFSIALISSFFEEEENHLLFILERKEKRFPTTV